jgi:hypothetical protein
MPHFDVAQFERSALFKGTSRVAPLPAELCPTSSKGPIRDTGKPVTGTYPNRLIDRVRAAKGHR